MGLLDLIVPFINSFTPGVNPSKTIRRNTSDDDGNVSTFAFRTVNSFSVTSRVYLCPPLPFNTNAHLDDLMRLANSDAVILLRFLA